jgi:cob(I)alamin adenosyltransferase
MKIYTKTGDDGTTSLIMGERVQKFNPSIEAYGTVDELNAFLGQLYDQVNEDPIKKTLFIIINKLFNIGSILACPLEYRKDLPHIQQIDITFLETEIDQLSTTLKPLTNFILPCGHPQVSQAHICRTITRRAERRVAELMQTDEFSKDILVYLNRLSDYFFILARHLSFRNDVEEIKWQKEV